MHFTALPPIRVCGRRGRPWWSAGHWPAGGRGAGLRPAYPADVLAPLPRGEGLRAHDHAAPHEGALLGAQAAAVLGADRHPGVTGLLGVGLFIDLERKSGPIRRGRMWIHFCSFLPPPKATADLPTEPHSVPGPLLREARGVTPCGNPGRWLSAEK